ncbi:hypothetical protein [uncultured Nocardioides sp.]|nr:hypothetical protein [uncultured Nocardioides sp.]
MQNAPVGIPITWRAAGALAVSVAGPDGRRGGPRGAHLDGVRRG